MVAHDELFCRLAIRHGFLDQPTGVEVLKRYRAEGRHGETIDQFVLEEGYLDEATTAQLETAIKKRASGHVTEEGPRRARTRAGKSVPQVRTGAGAVRHHHHTPAMARTVKSSPTQLAFSGGAILVLVVMVIVLIVNMQTTTNVADTATGKNRPEKVATTTESSETSLAKTAFETHIPTPEEIAKLEASLSQAIANARMEHQYPVRGVKILENWKANCGMGESLPVEISPMYDEAVKAQKQALADRYADLFAEYQELKEKGDDGASDVLQDIETKCGKDYAAKAEQGEGPSSAKE